MWTFSTIFSKSIFAKWSTSVDSYEVFLEFLVSELNKYAQNHKSLNDVVIIFLDEHFVSFPFITGN